jgi:hypothetical protein
MKINPQGGAAMSVMCSMKVCTEKAGMCGHEKIMLAVVLLLAISGAAYFLL